MSANKDQGPTPISQARTLDEVAEYWDEHSLADHWPETHEVEVEVRARRRHQVSLDPDVFGEIQAEARQRGIAAETLVNLWLKERLEAIASGRD
jgi:hypothetical protein